MAVILQSKSPLDRIKSINELKWMVQQKSKLVEKEDVLFLQREVKKGDQVN